MLTQHDIRTILIEILEFVCVIVCSSAGYTTEKLQDAINYLEEADRKDRSVIPVMLVSDEAEVV